MKKMKHFLDIDQLSLDQIHSLLERALTFKNKREAPNYASQTVAHLFYEQSTRTRVSFELAARRLGLTVVNFNTHYSSEAKGEVLEDTFDTLSAMGVNLFVIRHGQNRLPHDLAKKSTQTVHIINAGDGQHAHPSQAMLDLMTIVEKKPHLRELKIVIVGDIRHSRVANSLQCLFSRINIGELVLVAPKIWQPQTSYFGRITHSLEDGLVNADVVICLRVQKERLLDNERLDLKTYRREYAITEQTLRYARSDVMVMHPGPLNRGVEIDSKVADGPLSFILQQVTNGVFMRMAIIESLIR